MAGQEQVDYTDRGDMARLIGLPVEEMLEIFNRMYLSSWQGNREIVRWELAKISQQLRDGQEVDITDLLMKSNEQTVIAMRDALALVLYENNVKIYDDLRKAGVALPEPAPEGSEDDEFEPEAHGD